MHLQRQAIVSAALNLLDEYGLADVTMRRVASTLSVAPGALYWHVTNKQSLIAAMTAEIIAPLAGHSPEELALHLRALLLAHRDGAEVASAGLSLPGSALWDSLVERFTRAIVGRAGGPVDANAARVAALSIVHLVLGAALRETAQAQLIASEDHPSATIETSGDEHPDGAAVISAAVNMILAGLAADVRPGG